MTSATLVPMALLSVFSLVSGIASVKTEVLNDNDEEPSLN
jgi:hypothetical protein